MNRRQQYLVVRYVMAESASEAIRKSAKLPVHECYISNQWFEKVANSEFNRETPAAVTGFKKLSTGGKVKAT